MAEELTVNPVPPYISHSYMMSTNSSWNTIKKFNQFIEGNKEEIEPIKQKFNVQDVLQMLTDKENDGE